MVIKIFSIISFLIYHVTLVDLYYIKFYKYIELAFALLALAMLVIKKQEDMYKKDSKINVCVIIFAIIIVISSVINKQNMQRGILYALKIVDVFLFGQYIIYLKKEKEVLSIFYKLTLFYVLFTDFLLLCIPNLFVKFEYHYLVGDKFYVTYLHIFLIVFSMTLNEKRKKYIIYYILSFFIALKVQCTTAIVGLAILAILDWTKQKKMKRDTLVSILIVLCLIFILGSSIYKMEIFQSIIVNVFKKDPTLSGRFYIYNNILPILSEKLMLGHGYGNSYEILMEVLGYPNTQNGLMECIFDYGILGTIFFLILMKAQLKKSNSKNIYQPLYYCLVVFSILAMIEITLDIRFILFLAIINFEKRKEKIDE